MPQELLDRLSAAIQEINDISGEAAKIGFEVEVSGYIPTQALGGGSTSWLHKATIKAEMV